MYLVAIEQAQAIDRADEWRGATEEFDADHIVASVIAMLNRAHLGGRIAPEPEVQSQGWHVFTKILRDE